jgi:hypothetical protein
MTQSSSYIILYPRWIIITTYLIGRPTADIVDTSNPRYRTESTDTKRLTDARYRTHRRYLGIWLDSHSVFRLVCCLWNGAFWLVDERSIEVFVFWPFKNGMVNVPKLPCIGGILLDNTTATSSLKQWRGQKPMKTEKRANIYHSDMDNDRVQTYRRIVSTMFNDGVINMGRVLVLFWLGMLLVPVSKWRRVLVTSSYIQDE